MQPLATMMATVKDLISSIDLGKRFDVVADLAKHGSKSATHLAKRGSKSAVVLAKKVGPKRGALIGLALVGAAIGGVVLVRYLRNRGESEQGLDASGNPMMGKRHRKPDRASMTH